MDKIKKAFFFFIFFVGNLFGYELAIAAMFQDEGPYFKEWIEYHLMVGVDHFWLYDNGSQDNGLEVLSPYIEKGLVEVIPWNFSSEMEHGFPVKMQKEMMRDAILRSKGKTKWLALIDVDEFILPKKEKTVVDCLDKHFSAAQAVFVNWLNFGTSGVAISQGDPLLCKLTACSMKSYQKNGNGKSIVRPEEVDAMGWVHWATLHPGSGYRNGDGKPVIMEGEGANWDWNFHDKHIRIHHYFLRDENFFHKKRLALARKGLGAYSEETLWEFHELLGRQKDRSMQNFIEKWHPEKYKEFWNE